MSEKAAWRWLIFLVVFLALFCLLFYGLFGLKGLTKDPVWIWIGAISMASLCRLGIPRRLKPVYFAVCVAMALVPLLLSIRSERSNILMDAAMAAFCAAWCAFLIYVAGASNTNLAGESSANQGVASD